MKRAFLWTLVLALGGLGCSEEPETRPAQAGDPCQGILDCASGGKLACREQICQEIPCERSASCPFGSACVGGFCTVAECIETEECVEGETCFEGDCRDDICQTKFDCRDDQICRGEPSICIDPPERCGSDADCPGIEVCNTIEERCTIACVQDAECEGSQYCARNFCRIPCTDEELCLDDEVCFQERCQLRGDCSGQAECPIETPLRNPVTCECSECLADLDCNLARSEACIGLSCTVCLERTELASVCQTLGLRLLGGCCVPCIDDADCSEAGESCEAGLCVRPQGSPCISDEECAGELLCDGSRCVVEASLSECSIQSDCPTGEACYADGLCRQEAEVCQDCEAPGRCVAEPGDTVGSCRGCVSSCSTAGCPEGTLCFQDEGELEGVCIQEALLNGLCR